MFTISPPDFVNKCIFFYGFDEMKRKQYMREYMAQRRREECLGRKVCEACGSPDQLLLLDCRDKSTLTTKQLDKLRACCLSCLFKSQPILQRQAANK